MKTEMDLTHEGACLTQGMRNRLVEGTYHRANSLTVVKCSLHAVLSDWAGMDDATKQDFVRMALERTDELIGALGSDVEVLQV